MRSVIVKCARRIAAVILPETVRYQGSVLPAKHLRFCGMDFLNDRYFLISAQGDADRLVKHLGLTLKSCVLDVGCGVGRLPIGLLRQVGPIETYRGIDISESAIRWCQRNITTQDSRFQFVHIDMYNERYNPNGLIKTADLKLPFEDQTFDIIYLYSVFSHLKETDILAYLKEFNRLLKVSGRIFLTAFLEEGVSEIEVNPQGYNRRWTGPLHCVRYNKRLFESLLAENGFKVDRLEYATETDGQSGLYLSRNNNRIG